MNTKQLQSLIPETTFREWTHVLSCAKSCRKIKCLAVSLHINNKGAFACTAKNVKTVKRFEKTTCGAIQHPLRIDLSQNKSCHFQLKYIGMQLNQHLLVANISENRYSWTEPPDVERTFRCRQISATRLKSRQHESGATTMAIVIRLVANTTK